MPPEGAGRPHVYLTKPTNLRQRAIVITHHPIHGGRASTAAPVASRVRLFHHVPLNRPDTGT